MPIPIRGTESADPNAVSWTESGSMKRTPELWQQNSRTVCRTTVEQIWAGTIVAMSLGRTRLRWKKLIPE